MCWFLGFLFLKFLGFLVSWFVGFFFFFIIGLLVSKFQSFRDSNFQSFKTSLNVFWKYYQNPFHAFRKRLLSHSRFHEIRRWIFMISQRPSVPQVSKCSISESLKFPKIIFPKTFPFFLNYLGYPGVSKDKTYWFWESWTRPKIPKS